MTHTLHDHPRDHAHAGHGHGHGHGHEHSHAHDGRWARVRHAVSDVFGAHSHDAADQVGEALEVDVRGRRALWISLGVLALTAGLQAVVVTLTGSVALLGDTLHNVADALTAVPLLVAFWLARRPANDRFTYGHGTAAADQCGPSHQYRRSAPLGSALMNIFEFDGKSPQIHPDAWVAPTATLVGDVRLGPNASVWYGAVLRADVGPIIIGEGSNVQDNSVLHVRPGSSLEMGAHSTVAHGCVVHGDRIGTGSLIGNGAVVSDAVVIGDGCLIAAGAMVVEGTEVPDHSLVMGVPARIRGTIEAGTNPATILELNAPGYVEFMKLHRATVRPVSPSS